MGSLEGLEKHYEQKTITAIKKSKEAISELKLTGEPINFSNISKISGVSKNFLYTNTELRKIVEELRKNQVSKEINKRAKFDKTANSKDIIIATKDKKIARLEEEIKSLKLQINNLQAIIYKKE